MAASDRRQRPLPGRDGPRRAGELPGAGGAGADTPEGAWWRRRWWPRTWSALSWQITVVVLLAAAVAAFDLVEQQWHGYFDLKVYYGAINAWRDGRAELYTYHLPGSRYGFTYPPFAALVMLPMTVTPWPAAVTVSIVLNVVAALVVLYLFLDPVARRRGWPRWFVLAVAFCLALAYEPLRETINFGQVNMALLMLVVVDVLLLVSRGRALGGVGIGLATAVKLTPGIFLVYLLVTRRWRAAAVAAGTAAAATVLAHLVFPAESGQFWRETLWQTDRVGWPGFISNQSLSGAMNRMHPLGVGAWTAALVLLVLVVWAVRARRAAAAGDEKLGLALTGVVGCLVSPITWVHHLVWLLPAILLLVDRGLDLRRPRWRRENLLRGALVVWALLCSRLVWHFQREPRLSDKVFGNAYVWLSLILLVAVPPAEPTARELRAKGSSAGGTGRDGIGQDVAHLGQVDGVVGGGDPVVLDRPVRVEAGPVVEPSGPVVRGEHP